MKTIYWSDWRMLNFQINFKHQFNHSGDTCGGCCVSMLTGEDPARVDAKLKWKNDCTTAKMVRNLRTKKFSVAEIPPGFITAKMPRYNWLADTLTDEHLVLFNAETNIDEASWFLHYRGVIWHNFEKWTDSPLFLLRNPPQDVLLVKK